MRGAVRGLGWSIAGMAGSMLIIVSCSHGPVPSLKDPARGEFYTADELTRLPAAERDRYCSYMENTLHSLKTETRRLQVLLDSLEAEADTLRTQQVDVSAETRKLSMQIRETRLKQKAVQTYIVKKGDTLRKIASTVYGDPTRWREIYEANRGMLGEEDSELRAGSRLHIPR